MLWHSLSAHFLSEQCLSLQDFSEHSGFLYLEHCSGLASHFPHILSPGGHVSEHSFFATCGASWHGLSQGLSQDLSQGLSWQCLFSLLHLPSVEQHI